jgi:hypothetical protein
MMVIIMHYLLFVIFILSLLSNVKSERKSIMPIKINNIQENKVNDKRFIEIKERIYEWLEKKKVFEWMEKKRLFEILDEKEYNEFIIKMIEV